jgi:hypothetical protein
MKPKNALFVIKPYRWNGMWVFDDPDVGLVKEPFVSGIPAIIEEATKNIPNAEKGFVAIFSENPFPGFDVELEMLREEYGGNWYRWNKTKQEGWLCPALFKYYESAPKRIYIKIESLQ